MDEIIVIALAGYLVSLGATFMLGRNFEKRQVLRVLPTEMQATCEDCQAVGEKSGYQKGIDTCNDVLNSIDEQNHR